MRLFRNRETLVACMLGCLIGVFLANIPTICVQSELLYLDYLFRTPRRMPAGNLEQSYSRELDLVQFMEAHGAGQSVARHLIRHLDDDSWYSRDGAVGLLLELKDESVVAALPALERMSRDEDLEPGVSSAAISVRRSIISRLSQSRNATGK
ncbi:MAG: hypothetical protein JWP89_2995 [Schlesneria sp.]|nr:hypothetical protein [Schlesneria sp.]